MTTNADRPLVFVVVDMQSEYPAARDPALIAAIQKRAQAVVDAGGLVLHLLYCSSGASVVDLPEEAVELYKEHDDGGTVLAAYFKGRELWPSLVRLAGVNLSACVWATATSLARYFRDEEIRSPVEIVADLCRDNTSLPVTVLASWPRT